MSDEIKEIQKNEKYAKKTTFDYFKRYVMNKILEQSAIERREQRRAGEEIFKKANEATFKLYEAIQKKVDLSEGKSLKDMPIDNLKAIVKDIRDFEKSYKEMQDAQETVE